MKERLLSIGGSLLLVVMVLVALSQGSSGIPLHDIVTIGSYRLGLLNELPPELMTSDAIVWSVRMPRIVMACLSGSGLALVGASIQALVRNPMADPWLLGVSSGASFGAVLVIIGGLSFFGSASVPALAFLGALGASALIYRYSLRNTALSSARLIFTGLAISFCLEACTQLLIFSSPQASKVQNVLFWTMGSFGSVENEDLLLPAVALFIGFAFLWRKSHELNIICLAETKAFSLGLDLRSFRRQIFVLCAALTSVLVSITGSIGFVGLMIPHVLRMIVGHDHRRLLPACFLGGAIFMVAADFIARNAFGPKDIPIGVMTALLGSPIFIWLVRKSDA